MTAQVSESLVVRGQVLDMEQRPLEHYLRRLRTARRPDFNWTCTTCLRGYEGRWAICNGGLWLLGLSGAVGEARRPVDLAAALPWLSAPVFARWFTGALPCPEGRRIEYVHRGFATTCERTRCFHVERGVVVAETLTVNPPSPQSFEVDLQSGALSDPDCSLSLRRGASSLLSPDETPDAPTLWRRAAQALEDGVVA